MLGDLHADTLTSFNDLGLALRNQGHLAEALDRRPDPRGQFQLLLLHESFVELVVRLGITTGSVGRWIVGAAREAPIMVKN